MAAQDGRTNLPLKLARHSQTEFLLKCAARVKVGGNGVRDRSGPPCGPHRPKHEVMHVCKACSQQVGVAATPLLFEPEDPVPEVTVDCFKSRWRGVPRWRPVAMLIEEEKVDLRRTPKDEHVARMRSVWIPLLCKWSQRTDERRKALGDRVKVVGLHGKVPIGQVVPPPGRAGTCQSHRLNLRMLDEQRRNGRRDVHTLDVSQVYATSGRACSRARASACDQLASHQGVQPPPARAAGSSSR
jgi:hypothetical protein